MNSFRTFWSTHVIHFTETEDQPKPRGQEMQYTKIVGYKNISLKHTHDIVTSALEGCATHSLYAN